MQGFNGGIEDYGDSMASHYLIEEPEDTVKYPETKIMKSEDGKHTTVIGLGRNRTKLKPEDINPSVIGPQRFMAPVASPRGQWVYGEDSMELGTRTMDPDLAYSEKGPGALSAQKAPEWGKFRQKEADAAELDSRRANATDFVGETPNVQRPLSPEKQARIPIDISPEDKLKAMQRMSEYDRPNLVRDTTQADVTPADIAKEQAGGSQQGNSVVRQVLSGISAEPRKFGRGINARTGEFFSDKEIGEREWRAAERDAWAELRKPAGRSGGGGFSWPGMHETASGRVVDLAGKSGSFVTEKPTDSGRGALPGRKGPDLPPTHPKPANTQDTDVRSAVMPGYDPTGEKGIYEGHEELQAQIAERLKGMSPAAAIHAGTLVETMAKMAGKGNTTAIDRSIQAGQQVSSAIAMSQQKAPKSLLLLQCND